MPSGVMIPLGARQRQNIAKRLPLVDLAKIERIGADYCIERDHDDEKPAKVKAALQDIAEKAGALYVALSSMKEETRAELWDACGKAGRADLWLEVEASSRLLIGVARSAHLDTEVPEHRLKGPKRSLILSLADVLDSVGMAPDARPKGDLCFLTEEVLMSCGEDVGSQRTSVRAAMAERSTRAA
jgi:hypothetical protein